MTQESLRAQISVVTQDTSLLHRSVRENIRYGRPDASEAEMVEAARLAHADEFIPSWRLARQPRLRRPCRRARRQALGRPAPARRHRPGDPANAPILVLDEATSALDGEIEAAIQASLDTLMAGKTVIAIAHRLSTIARMDRLVVLDRGRIAEQGTHEALLRLNGHYAALWRRQSGGFLPPPTWKRRSRGATFGARGPVAARRPYGPPLNQPPCLVTRSKRRVSGTVPVQAQDESADSP